MNITNTESTQAQQNLEQSKLYEPVQLLSIQEQVKLDLFSNANDYIKVGSTVEWPILDETNQLYKVDGIDDDILFDVLNLHRLSSRRTDSKKEQDPDYMDLKDTEPYQTINTSFGTTEEVRSHTKNWNIILSSTDSDGTEDESLTDIVWWTQMKSNKVNSKLSTLKKWMMFNLDALRKEYHYRVEQKDTALWNRYVFCERNVKTIFNKIKWIEHLKKKLDEQLNVLYFKKNIKKQMDKLFDLYVDWQQRQLQADKDPELSFEECIEKSYPSYVKYLTLYNSLSS